MPRLHHPADLRRSCSKFRRRTGLQQARIKSNGLASNPRTGIFSDYDLKARLAEADSKVGVLDEGFDLGGQFFAIIRWDKKSVSTVTRDFAAAWNVCSNQGPAARCRLQQALGQAFPARGQNRDVGLGPDGPDVRHMAKQPE